MLNPDEPLEAQVEARYSGEIQWLTTLGFRKLAIMQVIDLTPPNWVQRLRGWLDGDAKRKKPQQVTYDAVLALPDEAVYSRVSELGMAFFTRFTNGGMMVVTSYRGQKVAIYPRYWRYAVSLKCNPHEMEALTEAWRIQVYQQQHLKWSGYGVTHPPNVEDYIALCQQHDARLLQYRQVQ